MPTRSKNKDSYNSLAFLGPLRLIGTLVIATIVHNGYEDTQGAFPNSTFFAFFKYYGMFFAEMFFIISGMMFYLAYYKRLKTSKLSYGEFAKNRFLKLYPVMVFSIIFFYITFSILNATGGIVKNPDGPTGVGNFFISLFVGDLKAFGGPKSMNTPLWYVTVLITCYLVACLITYFTRNKKKGIIFFLIPLIFGVLLYTLHRVPQQYIESDNIVRGFVNFFIGFYLMVFLEKFKTFNNTKKAMYRIGSALCILAVILLIVLKYDEWFTYDYVNKIRPTFHKIDTAIMFGVLVFPQLFTICYDVKWINKPLSNKYVTKACSIQYPMYVLDEPIRFAMQKWGWDFLPRPAHWVILICIEVLAATTYTIADSYIRKFIKTKIEKPKQVKTA